MAAPKILKDKRLNALSLREAVERLRERERERHDEGTFACSASIISKFEREKEKQTSRDLLVLFLLREAYELLLSLLHNIQSSRYISISRIARCAPHIIARRMQMLISAYSVHCKRRLLAVYRYVLFYLILFIPLFFFSLENTSGVQTYLGISQV